MKLVWLPLLLVACGSPTCPKGNSYSPTLKACVAAVPEEDPDTETTPASTGDTSAETGGTGSTTTSMTTPTGDTSSPSSTTPTGDTAPSTPGALATAMATNCGLAVVDVSVDVTGDFATALWNVWFDGAVEQHGLTAVTAGAERTLQRGYFAASTSTNWGCETPFEIATVRIYNTSGDVLDCAGLGDVAGLATANMTGVLAPAELDGCRAL